MVDANLEISGTVDKTEEDACLITLDLVDEQCRFAWTEVCRKIEDFLFHLDNLPVQDHV